MFRKIVSNLSFSPALIHQLGFYANRLRKEETTRRVGLVFTVLALVVQSLAVFQPPEAANASSRADFVPGGVSSVRDFLRYYDQNYHHIKTIYNSLGIKRAEIAKAKYTVIGEKSRYNWSMTSLYSHAQGQRSWSYGGGKAYYRPMRLTKEGGNRHGVFYAYSATQGWFAIKKDCGNLITAHPPHKPKPVALCQNLSISRLSDNKFRFNAKGYTKNGAKINGYVYGIKNSAGKVVKVIKHASHATTNSADYVQSTAGTYHVTLAVTTSQGTKYNKNCAGYFAVSQKPAAQCIALKAAAANRTIVSLSGSGAAQHGAKISKYTFVVKDASGKVVKTVAVDSASTTATADSFSLPEGKYTVQLTLSTSVGARTSSACTTAITIAPPEKCAYNPSLPVGSPECQPCPGDDTLWIKDDECRSEIIETKTATNMTQGNVDAGKTRAKSSDKIRYTLKVSNVGNAPKTMDMKEELGDVLEYAKIIDNGGGDYNAKTKTLVWKDVKIDAESSETRTVVVQVMHKIPATNTGTSNADSYNCVMTNTFGNSVDVKVKCPEQKVIVENTVEDLPHTGPRENMIFAGIVFALVVYFYTRSRQLSTEVRLIRKNVNSGAL